MDDEKLTKIEQKIAGIRDRILLACLSGDKETAATSMNELIAAYEKGEFSEGHAQEVRCRMLESRLDIDAISDQPVEALVKTLKEICRSPDFVDARRREVIARGLDKIAGAASQ